ncbi:hypothetical protein MRX96_056345 [Rhipicephalus microplus]
MQETESGLILRGLKGFCPESPLATRRTLVCLTTTMRRKDIEISCWQEYLTDANVNSIPRRKVLDLLAFQNNVGLALIMSHKNGAKKRGRPSNEAKEPPRKVHNAELRPVNAVRSNTGKCLRTLTAKQIIKKEYYVKLLPGNVLTRDMVCKISFPKVPNTRFIPDYNGDENCLARCFMPESVYGFETVLPTFLPDNSPCTENNGLDGEALEEDLYHDPKLFASVIVSEEDGLQLEGVLGTKLAIKPLGGQGRSAGSGDVPHLVYKIEDHDGVYAGQGLDMGERTYYGWNGNLLGSAARMMEPQVARILQQAAPGMTVTS